MTPKPTNLIRFICYILLAVGTLYSCGKHADVKPITPATTANITGKVYLAVDDSLKMLDAQTGTKVWAINNSHGFGSAGAPLLYDPGFIYYGSVGDMACYNASTGKPAWAVEHSIPDDGLNSDFRVPAFADDSLVVLTYPTSHYAGLANIYCLNKNTGALKWKQPIDHNRIGLDEFNSIPATVNGKVVAMVKDENSNFELACFEPLTGQQIWQAAANDDISSFLKVDNNNIYFPMGKNIYCYNGTDGSVLWHDATTATGVYTGSFFDDKYLYIMYQNANYTFNVLVIDKASGSIAKSITSTAINNLIPTRFTYKNGILYVFYFNNDNSTGAIDGMLKVYDLATMQVKWSYAYTFVSNVPLVTDKYVILAAYTKDNPQDQINPYSKMVFLNLNGTLLKEIKFPGFNVSRFIYIENNTVYTDETY